MDHNATSPVEPRVLEAMIAAYRDVPGNASSVHTFGQKAREAVDEARGKVARLIGARPDEVVFTSGGTESDNTAIKGVCWALEKKGRHIITSAVEHHAVLNTCAFMEQEGWHVTKVGVDSYGMVDPAEIEKAVTKETVLITVMHANNEVGTIQPIREISGIARRRRIMFHTDAVQTVGKVPVSVEELGVDLLSLSAHKFYGPKGVGVLYVRKGTRMYPLIQGGHHESGRRAGTENVQGIVGLGVAAEIALNEMVSEAVTVSALRDKLQSGIVERIEDVHVTGHPEKRLPNTLNACFEYIEGESIILGLDHEGIAVATGSACTSGSLEPSHVLAAMGVDRALSQGSVRFSLGRENTGEDVDRVLDVLPGIIQRLRDMSPLYAKKGCACAGGTCAR
jgi:cysteine desulfurase